MLKEQTALLALLVYATDLAATALAFLSAWWLRSRLLPALLPAVFPTGLYPLTAYAPLLPWVLLIWSIAFLATRSYRSQRTVGLPQQILTAAKVSFGSALVLMALVFALRFDFVSRPWIGTFAVLSFLFLSAGRLSVRLVARGVRRRGYNYRTILVVGTGERARELGESVRAHAHWGLRLVGFIAEDDRPPAQELGAPVLGDLASFQRILTTPDRHIDEVLFVISRSRLTDVDAALLLCEELGVRTRISLDFLPLALARLELEEFDGVPLLTFSRTPTDPFALLGKRFADLVLSALMVFAVSPLLALIALAIRLTSPGPVLFRQIRCGLNGRQFTLLKFRTMVEDAHQRRDEVAHLNEMDGPVFKITRDPRVTFVGRFLRRWSFDELPQLFNVLRGDMSLVGPRPPLPEEVVRYERWQRRRLSMKPGLTCLWQISGRSDIDFERWMELDLQYIDNWTPMLDIKILAKTVPAVLTGRGAR